MIRDMQRIHNENRIKYIAIACNSKEKPVNWLDGNMQLTPE